MEETFIFAFKIGSEYVFPKVIFNFSLRPKASSIQFLCIGKDLFIVCCFMYIDKFFLTIALKNILSNAFRDIISYP